MTDWIVDSDSIHFCEIDETQMGEDAMTSPIQQMFPMKKLKKSFNYGPAPKQMVEAVRKQLRVMIESPTFEDDIGKIGRFAHHAEDMLLMLRKAEAVMRNEHEVTLPGVTSDAMMNAETYGATIVRQVIPALLQYQKAQHETPSMLVLALEQARAAGMTDVSAAIEIKLLGKPLDGQRPIGHVNLPLLSDGVKKKPEDNSKKSPKVPTKKAHVANGASAHVDGNAQ